MDGGSWRQSGIAIVLLLISSVDPRTMLRFFGGIALAAAAVALAWATQSQSQPPPAVAKSGPAAPVLHRTAGEMPVNADWFDRIFENARRPREPKSERPRRRRDDRPKAETYRTSLRQALRWVLLSHQLLDSARAVRGRCQAMRAELPHRIPALRASQPWSGCR